MWFLAYITLACLPILNYILLPPCLLDMLLWGIFPYILMLVQNQSWMLIRLSVFSMNPKASYSFKWWLDIILFVVYGLSFSSCQILITRTFIILSAFAFCFSERNVTALCEEVCNFASVLYWTVMLNQVLLYHMKNKLLPVSSLISKFYLWFFFLQFILIPRNRI